jgi:DNA-binding LacI/PurR family transcriptional regulator
LVLDWFLPAWNPNFYLNLTKGQQLPILSWVTRVTNISRIELKSRRITSHDVAKLAGVSRTTVSFVLNNVPGVSISQATRQRVLEAAKQLNYHPHATGKKLASGKSYTLGLVLLQNPEQVFEDAFLIQVLLGVEQAASRQGFNVLLKPVAPDDNSGYSRLINENHVDGIILSGPRQDDDEIVRLKSEGVPIMLMGQLPESGIPFVDVDAIEGAAIAVRHLLELGRRRIAMITNASLNYISAQHRRSGYEQSIADSGLFLEEELVREGDYTPASGFRAMQILLNLPRRPDAVFIASDVVAIGAIQAIKQAGLRIPEDIAVVGFDDVPLSEYYDPPLTTLRLPAFGLGWASGERLVRIIQGEELSQPGLVLDSELVVRASSIGNTFSA